MTGGKRASNQFTNAFYSFNVEQETWTRLDDYPGHYRFRVACTLHQLSTGEKRFFVVSKFKVMIHYCMLYNLAIYILLDRWKTKYPEENRRSIQFKQSNLANKPQRDHSRSNGINGGVFRWGKIISLWRK